MGFHLVNKTSKHSITVNEKNRIGDISEHKAVVWLLEQGYEVFRNECCSGPIDIIALNIETQEILKIDVKTGAIYIREDGTRKVNHGKLTEIQKKLQEILKIDVKTGAIYIRYV